MIFVLLLLFAQFYKSCFQKYQIIMLCGNNNIRHIFQYNDCNNNVLLADSNYIEYGNVNDSYTEFVCKLLQNYKYKDCNGSNWFKRHRLEHRLYFEDNKFGMYGYITFYNSIAFIKENIFNIRFITKIRFEIDIIKSKYSFDEYNKHMIQNCYDHNKNIVQYSIEYDNKVVNLFKMETKIPNFKCEYVPNNYFPGLVHLLSGNLEHSKWQYISQLYLHTENDKSVRMLSENDKKLPRNNILIINNLDNFHCCQEKLYLLLDMARFRENSILIICVNDCEKVLTQFPKLSNYVTGFPVYLK
jgi:hypothetical protein